MIQRSYEIAVVQGTAKHWMKMARRQIEEEQSRLENLQQFLEELDTLCEGLDTKSCPFCRGEIIDYSPLKPMADAVNVAGHVHHSHKPIFDLKCQHCASYRTGSPVNTALRWKPEDVDPKDTVFAAEIFDNIYQVQEVALERAAGRGWMFRIGEDWYANWGTKGQLKDLWAV